MVFWRGRPVERTVLLERRALDSILSYCKMKHPNEGILILKGRSRAGEITVSDLVIPPFNYSGPSYAMFSHSFLPFDRSYVGSVHSHPSGTAEPSLTDLHNFFGLVSLIVRFPYEDDSVFAWDSKGGPVPLSVLEDADAAPGVGGGGRPAGGSGPGGTDPATSLGDKTL